MKSFKNLALAHAVALRADVEPKAPWLRSAREAFMEFHAPEGGDARRLAERMAAIADWPENEEGELDSDAILSDIEDQLAPIRDLMANAFCKIGQDKEGREAALLWGGESVAFVDDGLRLESKAGEVFKSRSPESMFSASGWDGLDKEEGDRMRGFAHPSRIERFLETISSGMSPTHEETAESLARRPEDSSAPSLPDVADFESRAKAFAGQRDDKEAHDESISEAVARGALGLAMDPRAAADLKRLRRFERALTGGFASIYASIYSIEPEKPEPEPAALSKGEEAAITGAKRAVRLSSALERAGQRALEGARADAAARLMSFMEKRAPGSGAAAELAKRVWGLPLSADASVAASSWLPAAARLMSEDPRRAALALTVAPDLGLSPGVDLLARTKAELKKAGLPEGVWKSLGELPKEDFETILTEFKRAASASTEYKKRGGSDDLFFDSSIFGGRPRVMERDPFESPPEAGASDELKRSCERCAFAQEAAILARLPLSNAVGFALSDNAASSPAWKERQSKEPKRGWAAGLEAHFGRGGGAESSFIDFCLGQEAEDRNRRGGARAMGPEELAAARAKGPRVLALAMRAASELPFKEALAQFSDITDWFRRSEPGLWQQLPEKMTWASLRRREQAWHKELQASKDAAFREPWEPMLVEPVIKGGFVARELATGAELFDEGKAMRHCVSSYAQDCREGSCRIYSIMDDQGRRVATLEAGLARGAKGARVAQLRGVANQLIEDPAVHALCEKLIERLNETARAKARAANGQGPKGQEESAPSLLPALAQRREGAGAPAAAPRPRA